MKKEAKHTPGPILNDGETPKGLMLLAGPEDREDEYWSCGPTDGEEIMVNTPYDVFILPLRPSGLSSGPRFVVHVPGPEQPAVHPAITHCDNCGCDWLDNGLNPAGCPYCKQHATAAQAAEIERLREALEDIRSRSLVDLVMRSDHLELIALLSDIYQIADSEL